MINRGGSEFEQALNFGGAEVAFGGAELAKFGGAEVAERAFGGSELENGTVLA